MTAYNAHGNPYVCFGTPQVAYSGLFHSQLKNYVKPNGAGGIRLPLKLCRLPIDAPPFGREGLEPTQITSTFRVASLLTKFIDIDKSTKFIDIDKSAGTPQGTRTLISQIKSLLF